MKTIKILIEKIAESDVRNKLVYSAENYARLNTKSDIQDFIIKCYDKKYSQVEKILEQNRKVNEVLEKFKIIPFIDDNIVESKEETKNTIFPKIQNLNLSGIKINNESADMIAEFIKTNTSLTDIDLSGCEISDKSMKSIIASLKENETLMLIDLSDNKINDGNAHEIAELLKTNTSLTDIDLGSCRISD